MNKKPPFNRLLTIMDELRENCPWDQKQTMESLSHLTIEETYELVDSILEKKSLKSLRDKFEKYYAVTDEKFNENEFEKNVSKEHRLVTKGIEVGHIFYFGNKYSNPMKAYGNP